MKKLIPLVILLAFAGCTPTITPEQEQEPQEEVAPVEETVVEEAREITDADLGVSEKSIEEETEHYTIYVVYPETIGATKLNQVIEDHVQETIDFFKAEVEETLPYLEDLEDIGKSSLYITYEIHTLSTKLASIQFGNSHYSAGAAHPNFYTSVLNYDMQENKEIELVDLFVEDSEYLVTLSDYVIPELADQMMIDFEYTDLEWITQGAAPEEVNYSAFVFNTDGLWFTFDPYIVGPYAIGPQYITVPYTLVDDILNDYANGLL
ncbi:RsiV family protein [Patescibacteria group bacterium]